MLAAYFLRLLPCIFVILIADCAISSDQKNDLIVGWRVGWTDDVAAERQQNRGSETVGESPDSLLLVAAAAAGQRVALGQSTLQCRGCGDDSPAGARLARVGARAKLRQVAVR